MVNNALKYIDGNTGGNVCCDDALKKDANAKVIKKLAQSLREYKKPTILTLIFITGEVFFEVLIPFFTADLVNAIKAFPQPGRRLPGCTML